MSISKALERSAKDFCGKYACNFSFAAIESRLEEFTFLRPNSGWGDLYRVTFEEVYRQAIERVELGESDTLDGEAMLDDFEYTLIRPYVKESEEEIRHKPYVGMSDRVARLEYLDRLARNAPSNPVELYTERYKSGALSIKQMRALTQSALAKSTQRARCVEIAGYIRALEVVNRGRSVLWRGFHPLRNNAEKRDAAQMKQMLMEALSGGEALYRELFEAAHKTFDGHERIVANLAESMTRAREEMNRKQKMSDAMRAYRHTDGFDTVS